MSEKNAADKRTAQGRDARPAKTSSKPKEGELRANGYKPLGEGLAKSGKPGAARPSAKPSTFKSGPAKSASPYKAAPRDAAPKPGEPGKVWSKPGVAKSAGARPDASKGGPKGAPRPGGKPGGPRPGGSAPPRGKR